MNAILQPADFRLDRSRHAAPQVFERLREQIVSMVLVPGTVLSRSELAAQFGVSQTPVRDALSRLGEEGLVDIFPQHATVVSQIDLSSARQAQFLRRSVELEVVRTLAESPAPELIALLEANLARQKAMLNLKDFVEFSRCDEEFHQLMYRAAHAPDLWTLVRRQSAHLDRLRHLHLPIPGKAKSILEDHSRLLRALRSGDAGAAQDYLRKHLSGTLSNVEEIRTRFPHYVKDGML